MHHSFMQSIMCFTFHFPTVIRIQTNQCLNATKQQVNCVFHKCGTVSAKLRHQDAMVSKAYDIATVEQHVKPAENHWGARTLLGCTLTLNLPSYTTGSIRPVVQGFSCPLSYILALGLGPASCIG